MATQVCDLCSAVQPHSRTTPRLLEFVYSDFRLDAPWTRTLRSNADYLRETPTISLSPWTALPGFDLTRVRFDIAHTVLLGVGKDMAASFLLDLAARA